MTSKNCQFCNNNFSLIQYDQFKRTLMAVCHISTYENYQDGSRQEFDAKKNLLKL